MLLNNVESDLKTRLEEEGITQKELAGQIGVSLPYVNRITRGREDRGMSETGRLLNENDKDLIRNGQDSEDFILEEEPESGEPTEEELREYERKEKRDNAIISTVIDGILTFLHLS